MLLKTKHEPSDPIDFAGIRRRFLAYVNSFCGIDAICRANILLKRNHSLRVSALAGLIGRRIRLAGEEIALARTIGLLHDVGRFEQFTRYRTFVDRLSIDHGAFGADLLGDIPAIQHLDAAAREVVCSAVAHHNKAALPPGLDPRRRLHAQLVRDADKLDILHLYTKDLHRQTHALIGPIKTWEISPPVLQALSRKEVVHYEDIKSTVDCLAAKLAWVYDVNFAASLQILRQRGYHARLSALLPQTKPMQAVCEAMQAHIDQALRTADGATPPGGSSAVTRAGSRADRGLQRIAPCRGRGC